MSDTSNRRIASPFGNAIDRSDTFTFTFDGKRISAHPGDTIGAALAAAGVKVLSRSFKYHRPRGLMCGAGHCPNCLVQVGDEPSVRACTRDATPGMVVRSQNAWPSLDHDVMALTSLADRFLPVGFYYKTFIRPQALWHAYEWMLRHAAGLGRLAPDGAPPDYRKQYLHADVVVVGGGPAGLSAARAAGERGARVLLLDENREIGGHLRYANWDLVDGNGDAETPESLPALRAALSALPEVTVMEGTTVLGYYEDHWLSAVCANELYKIRAGSVVVATGAYEQPLIFANNDLPGVMLGSGVQRLLRLYGVPPGAEAVVVTANDDGWLVAADLQRAGVAVRGVIEARPAPSSLAAPLQSTLAGAGVPVYLRSTILAAEGKGKVQAAVIAPVDEHGQPNTGGTTRLASDLIAVSVGWAPANGLLYEAGGRLGYEEATAEFLPQSLPPGIYAAGRVAGPGSPAEDIAAGRRAGRQAAIHALGEDAHPPSDVGDPAGGNGDAIPRTSSLVRVKEDGAKKRGKGFVCFCEDVTDGDVETAIAEGYNSIELLKRYSTISMGPCQGKMCSANTIHLCARANGWTVAETGTTTARPPTTPVSLGALAGQQMNPARVTPVHAWHEARGATMMVAGLWYRPEHYGDPAGEVEAVRQRVGLIDVSTLGKLDLHGPGVPGLLERLYVNRWQRLGVGRVRYGVMCNEEGVVFDDGVTARLGEVSYYMTTTSSGAGAVYEWIEWWRQSGWGEGVHVTPLTDAFAAFNLAGPRARHVLARLVDEDIGNEAFPYMSARTMAVAGVACRLLRIGFTGELSYEIHCPAGYGMALWEALMDAGADEGIRPFGVEAQRVLRLEKAHLIVGQDTDALSNPFAAGLGWAVKLDKSDFLGRRSLLRSTHEEPSQRLTGFKMRTPGLVPEEGVQIVSENGSGALEIIGHVTSSRYSPTLGEAIGLCWLPAALAEAGNAFTIRTSEGRLVEAVVHEGPFYDPEGERLQQ